MAERDAELEVASAIAEVKSTLVWLGEQIQQSTQSNNQRIDDLSRSMDRQTEAIHRRLEDHQRSSDQRFKAIENRLAAHDAEIEARQHDGKKAAGTGGLAGVITAVGIEIVKRTVGE